MQLYVGKINFSDADVMLLKSIGIRWNKPNDQDLPNYLEYDHEKCKNFIALKREESNKNIFTLFWGDEIIMTIIAAKPYSNNFDKCTVDLNQELINQIEKGKECRSRGVNFTTELTGATICSDELEWVERLTTSLFPDYSEMMSLFNEYKNKQVKKPPFTKKTSSTDTTVPILKLQNPEVADKAKYPNNFFQPCQNLPSLPASDPNLSSCPSEKNRQLQFK